MAACRVLHLISSLESGGCENMLLRTVPLLNRESEHVIVTLFRPGRLSEQFQARGISVVHINMRTLLDVAGLRRLTVELKRQQPSLVLTYLFHADVIGRLFVQRVMKVPVIPFLRTTYNFPRYLPARIFEWLTKHWAAHYLANSDAVKAYYVDRIGVSASKITVIPNGIDTAVFDQADGTAIVRELNLPDERFIIVCVANLAPNKGHRYLLEAFERVAVRHQQMYLLLVGTGVEESSLREQAAHLACHEKVLFLGRRNDVPDILAVADVFVLPTLFEGMSNAVMEAMAAALPILTTDIPENRALITQNESGLLAEPGSALPLGENLERLLQDKVLRTRLGAAARTTIAERFALPTIVQQWQNVIHRFAI